MNIQALLFVGAFLSGAAAVALAYNRAARHQDRIDRAVAKDFAEKANYKGRY